jgi:lysophospholipase L1-like esterase
MKRTTITGIIAGLSCVMAVVSGSGVSAIAPTAIIGFGDSRAAGTGLMPFTVPSVTDSLCWRSSWTATSILATTYTVPAYNVACSGATTKDILSAQTVSDGLGGFTTVPAQIDQLPVRLLTTRGSVVTIQTGANDVHWAETLGYCLGAALDCGSPQEQALFDASLVAMQTDLRAALDEITARGHKSQVLVGGVYDPFGGVDAAVLQAVYASYGVNLTVDEITWLRGLRADLNTAMQQVATEYAKKNVSFVPIDLTAGQIQTLADFAPFHPNYLGQSAIHDAFNAAI